jgi:hypothetical protein
VFPFVLFHGGKSKAESNRDLADTGFDRFIRNTMAQTFRTDNQIGRITTGEDD